MQRIGKILFSLNMGAWNVLVGQPLAADCHIYSLEGSMCRVYSIVASIDRCARLLRSVLVSIDDNDIPITWLI